MHLLMHIGKKFVNGNTHKLEKQDKNKPLIL